MSARGASAAPSSTTAITVVDSEKEKEEGESKEEQGLKLKKKEKEKKRVGWSAETVDNEHLGRKKSKCCCVYVKPPKFKAGPGGPGDDSSGDDSDGDECDHCPGHHGKDVKGG